MEELWGIVANGIGCLLLIVAVMGSFWLGVRSGRIRERSEASRVRIRQNKVSIYRYQQQLEGVREQIARLEEERKSLELRSEAYERTQSELSGYHRRIEELERNIQSLSNDNRSLDKKDGKPDVDVINLVRSLRNDPLHTNPSKEEWTEIISMTDLLFNNYLTRLQSTAHITRHEQEICCLIKWDFSRKEQLAVFNNTPDALTKSKGRLKKRLGLDEKTELDAYIRLS